MRKEITSRIIALDDDGLTIAEIAEAVGWPRQDVEKVLTQYFYAEDTMIKRQRRVTEEE